MDGSGFGAGGVIDDGTFRTQIVDIANQSLNCRMIVDAGDANSWDDVVHSQQWYDVHGTLNWALGTFSDPGTDDPTFVGTVGGLSSGEYWSLDGGDFWDSWSDTPAWMESFHKAGATFTLAFWMYRTNTGDFWLISDASSFAAGTGFGFALDVGAPQIVVLDGGGTPYPKNIVADTALSTGAWTFVGVSLDEAGGASGSFFYTDGAYNQVSSSDTFNGAYTTPATGDSDFWLSLMARGDNVEMAVNGTRLAGAFIWDRALSKADLDAVYNATKGRFGL
jgi:hypothetical protein